MTDGIPRDKSLPRFDGVMDVERLPEEKHVDQEIGIVESVLRMRTAYTYHDRDDEGKSHCRYPKFKDTKDNNEYEFDQMLASSVELIDGEPKHLIDYKQSLHLW
eukprot:CAMPEP_0115046952 /NCGR_PEP_ID=MMETSP0216-20121206/49033_1 /TAXON_ID=223996 /ORGANISM="Protocruzia adherens, Strain Boccale" /LENGTH=103 /DNA_ID=CAMNT_0002430087 /DNA_START=26 /DNA_END=334 /DNA_ORIENTATION=-